VRYQNICSALFGFVRKHVCDRPRDRQTDGRTDGQNYIAARAVKTNEIKTIIPWDVRLSWLEKKPIHVYFFSASDFDP